jgi:hypothetical protein
MRVVFHRFFSECFLVLYPHRHLGDDMIEPTNLIISMLPTYLYRTRLSIFDCAATHTASKKKKVRYNIIGKPTF